MTTVIERDALFGDVQVEVDGAAGTVAVRGDAIPATVLCRLEGAEPHRHSPIGSRDAAGLELLVEDVPASIRPGPGTLLRSSYRVEVEYTGRRYLLIADSLDKSELMRDSRTMGRLWAVAGAGVSAEWSTAWDVHAVDAAIGYVLAAGFGTGGQSLLYTIFHSFGQTASP